jgi:hypothetical protein
MISEELRESINAAVPQGVTHIGIVVTSVFGQILVTEPKNKPYGVVATLNKLKVQTGETPFETLVRCIREQISEPTQGVYPIPAVWITPNSAGFYFAGMIWNEGHAPPGSPDNKIWCDLEDARRRINNSHNAQSKKRDLALLLAASRMCLSPYRRILLMLQELHKMGFQRLRAPAYEREGIAWRCPIVPAYWTLRDHGGKYDDPSWQIEQTFGIHWSR